MELGNNGIELDVYKSLAEVGRLSWLPGFAQRLPWQDIYFGANYARIDSEIDLGESQGIQTNAQRPLQGQSKYVGNASISYQHPEGRTEATLLFNVFGERISRVGVNGLPDVYEQPFNQLDFTLAHQLPWDGWRMRCSSYASAIRRRRSGPSPGCGDASRSTGDASRSSSSPGATT